MTATAKLQAGGGTERDLGSVPPPRQDIHTAGIPVVCQSCEARHRGICGVLQPDELTMLSRHARKAHAHPGDELVGDGEAVDSYANVMRGVVKVTKTLEDGRQQIVGLKFAPDFLGRLYADENPNSVEAASEVELCVVPKATLEGMIDNSPALARRIMQQTLRELDDARDWLLTIGRKTASEKVASFLDLIATHADPAGEGAKSARFELPLTRGAIADFLGLTIETVSRQLGALKRRGTIRLIGLRVVQVPDMAALRALCG